MPPNTRETILETARTLFTQQGYTATSMREIAARSQIGKATIYHHFPNKESIALELVQNNSANVREFLTVLPENGDPRERITRATCASLSFFCESFELLTVIRREIPGGREVLQVSYEAFINRYRQLISAALEEGVQKGLFRPISIQNGAQVLLTLIQGSFALAYLTGTRPRSSEETAAMLLDVFFHGIDQK